MGVKDLQNRKIQGMALFPQAPQNGRFGVEDSGQPWWDFSKVPQLSSNIGSTAPHLNGPEAVQRSP